MLRVLVVDNTPGRASALRQALSAMPGVEVTCTLESPLELFARVAEHRPDIVLIDTDSPSRDVLEQLAAVSSGAPRPVVVFSDDAEQCTIRAALRVGVSAYVVEGVSPARLEPVMRVAIERFEADQALLAELSDAKSQLADRKVIERAKGILMAAKSLSEQDAYAMMRKAAMDQKRRLAEIARAIVMAEGMLK